METATLVKTAMEAAGTPSIRAFADLVGVKHPSVLRWLDGSATPTFEQCMCLAQLAGLDPVRTAAAVRLNSPDAHRYRGLLRRLAQAAACLALAVILPSGAQALEAPGSAVAASSSEPLYIMRTALRRFAASCARWWRSGWVPA